MDADSSGVVVVSTAGSKRLGVLRETIELGDVVMEENLEAIVERAGSVGFRVAKLGGEAIYENVKDTVGGFGAVVKTRPTIPGLNTKRERSQHPDLASKDPSFSPQHQKLEYEPLFNGQGIRLLKL